MHEILVKRRQLQSSDHAHRVRAASASSHCRMHSVETSAQENPTQRSNHGRDGQHGKMF